MKALRILFLTAMLAMMNYTVHAQTDTTQMKVKKAEDELKRNWLNKQLPNYKFYFLFEDQMTTMEGRGKVLVLNFWFIGCAPCLKEIPALNAVAKSYQSNKKVRFIAASLDTEERLQRFKETTPFQYEIASSTKPLMETLGSFFMPAHMVVDKEGIIRAITCTEQAGIEKWLKTEIDKLLQE